MNTVITWRDARDAYPSPFWLKVKDRSFHGLYGTPTYRSWDNMKQRCDNPDHPAYDNYGGRGISYDPQWASFEAFYLYVGPRPEPHPTEGKYSLDRIDNDGDYMPGNVRWATKKEQNNNKRDVLARRMK